MGLKERVKKRKRKRNHVLIFFSQKEIKILGEKAEVWI